MINNSSPIYYRKKNTKKRLAKGINIFLEKIKKINSNMVAKI